MYFLSEYETPIYVQPKFERTPAPGQEVLMAWGSVDFVEDQRELAMRTGKALAKSFGALAVPVRWFIRTPDGKPQLIPPSEAGYVNLAWRQAPSEAVLWLDARERIWWFERKRIGQFYNEVVANAGAPARLCADATESRNPP